MKALKYIVLIFILLVSPLFVEIVAAQPPPPTPVQIPVDGGLLFLLIAGMTYGAKKLHDNKNNDELVI